MRDDRLITVWILSICTVLGSSLAVGVVIYGPKAALTAAIGFLGAKLISCLHD